MQVVRAQDVRHSETASGVMTTLASPTLGGAATALWRVQVGPDNQPGPEHVIDTEQVWTFLSGGATVTVADIKVALTAGDTIVIPGAQLRQVTGDPTQGFEAIVTSPAGAQAALPGTTDFRTPPWIA
jgi:mannose-6-phosphate isomerase-like protein (cupin superfamily)